MATKAAPADPKQESLRKTKLDKSAPFFRDTKVLTCSKVVVKNGEAVAVAFPQKKTGYKSPGSYGNMGKSSERSSVSHAAHKETPIMHAGMAKKPLVKYDPSSYRNRLPQPTVVMPYKNSSQVVIGDRESAQKKQYISTNKNHFPAHHLGETVSNPGIMAEKTKRTHHAELK